MHAFRYDDLASTEPGSSFCLDSREETHLFRILRARPGETVALLDGHGTAGTAVVGSDHRLCLESKRTVLPPARRLHLYFAPPKKQKLDALLKQAVELGVFELVPMLCERSVVLPGENSVAGRWMDLLFEACKQTVGYKLTVDLDRQLVIEPDGKATHFEIAAFRRWAIMNGYDDIGITLANKQDKIRAFESERLAAKPWLAKTLNWQDK